MKITRSLLFVLLLISILVAGCNPQTATPTPVTAEPDKVIIWQPGTSGTVADWDFDPVLQEVEKATNTDITIMNIDWGAFIDQANIAIASGEFPDIIGHIGLGERALLESWAKDGIIAPIEGKVAEAAPNLLAEYETNTSLEEIKINGKAYFQPIGWGDGYYPNMGLLHVRKDLLDKYGMQPPDTFEQYYAYLEKCQTEEKIKGVSFGAESGLGYNLSAFTGAFGLPYEGWVKKDGDFEYYAVQPAMYDALMLFRELIVNDLYHPSSWEVNNEGARELYIAGETCSAIFNGGGYIGRIQSDMTLVNEDFKEWLLPAPEAGKGFRGYTSELMFTGVAAIGNMKNNHPEAAARVINYLISPEGYKLTAVGIPGRDYEEKDGKITLLPQRTKDGFPTEMGMTGSHPLGLAIVSWVPQDWQNWAFLYGKDASFEKWFQDMWANQGQYQIPSYGLAITTPLWTEFRPTSNELISRAFLNIVKAESQEEAKTLFDEFVKDWQDAGGTNATIEMDAVLSTLNP